MSEAQPGRAGSADTDPGGVHLPRVRALDGLRGVAVLAVLLFHDDRLRGGYLGVDLFFVLSGFLITSLLLVEHARDGMIRLRRFYARRARRLLPALGVALLGVALYAAVWAQPAELPRIRGDGLATLLYFANWRDVFSAHSYWDVFTAPSALQHTWSLSIEEQFYAIWPLAVIGVLVRRSARAVLGVALTLGAACAAFTVIAAYHDANQQFLYYSTVTRAPALLMGAALAALLALRGPVASRGARLTLEAVALASVVYLAWEWTHLAGEGWSLYRGPLLLCGLASVAVIAAASHPRPGLVSRALAFPPLVGAGLISYGLYLFHWPVYLVLTPARTGLTGWTLLLERVLVSVGIAVVSYLAIELPVRRGALRPRPAMVALAGAAALVVASLLVATEVATVAVPAASGSVAPRRVGSWPLPVAPLVPGADVRQYLPPGDWSRLTNSCEQARALPRVRRIVPNGAPRVLMLGDSVGCFVGAALDDQAPENGVVTLNRARIACPLVAPKRARDASGAPAAAVPACIDHQGAAITAFDPNVAILMVGGPFVDQADTGDGRWLSPCDGGFASWYEAGARRTVEVLAATGATVVVVTIVHPPHVVDIGPGVVMPASYDHDVDCENATFATWCTRSRALACSISTRSCARTATAAGRSTGSRCEWTAATSKVRPPTSSPDGCCRGCCSSRISTLVREVGGGRPTG